MEALGKTSPQAVLFTTTVSFLFCFFSFSICQVDYPTKLAKMQNVSDITLFVPSNFGADSTIITYLGFKGENTKASIKKSHEKKKEGNGDLSGALVHMFPLCFAQNM